MTVPRDCPHCGADLAVTGRPHCEPPKQRCRWLNCKECASRVSAGGRHCCGPLTECKVVAQ